MKKSTSTNLWIHKRRHNRIITPKLPMKKINKQNHEAISRYKNCHFICPRMNIYKMDCSRKGGKAIPSMFLCKYDWPMHTGWTIPKNSHAQVPHFDTQHRMITWSGPVSSPICAGAPNSCIKISFPTGIKYFLHITIILTPLFQE